METIKISKRLQAVAALIAKGNTVADIGTDHAYLPIYIVNQGISNRVIAMDVRQGPLEKAKENIWSYGVENYVCVRHSDGLDKLAPLEAQTITICGMGGKLIQSLLENGKDKYDGNTQLIVSPQSEIRAFREYLDTNGYFVTEEVMVKEEGQFYFIMECFRSAGKDAQGEQNALSDARLVPAYQREIQLRYGKRLLDKRDPVLKEYLEKERVNARRIYEKVGGAWKRDEAVGERLVQIAEDMKYIDRALEYYRTSGN